MGSSSGECQDPLLPQVRPPPSAGIPFFLKSGHRRVPGSPSSSSPVTSSSPSSTSVWLRGYVNSWDHVPGPWRDSTSGERRLLGLAVVAQGRGPVSERGRVAACGGRRRSQPGRRREADKSAPGSRRVGHRRRSAQTSSRLRAPAVT